MKLEIIVCFNALNFLTANQNDELSVAHLSLSWSSLSDDLVV